MIGLAIPFGNGLRNPFPVLSVGLSTSQIKVIMLSVVSDDATRERVLVAGADGYLTTSCWK